MADYLVRIRWDDGDDVVDVTRRCRCDGSSTDNLSIMLVDALAKSFEILIDETLARAVVHLLEWDNDGCCTWGGDRNGYVKEAQEAFFDAAEAYVDKIDTYRKALRVGCVEESDG